MTNFTDFALSERILEAISYMGFEKATPIQEQAIPKIIDGKDLIACAQTGTGKTAAFVLPVLHNISLGEQAGVKAVIIVPTRELAIQINQQIQGFSYFINIASYAVFGGGDGKEWEGERQALEGNASIIVATPGKLKAHLNMGYVDFTQVSHLILDEADKMLDMGFYDDIMTIVKHIPKERQTLMFSATMPPKIKQLAKQTLHEPDEITIAISKPAEGVLQAAFLAYDEQKIRLISNLIDDKPEYDSILIFTATKSNVTEIVKGIGRKDFKVAGISSNLNQDERNDVLSLFKAKQTRVLVATDVMSRGIDIKDINLVINYDVPDDAEDYVHRVGRTARANTTGVALTFINPKDMPRFKRIEELIEKEIMKLPLPPELGEGPEWNAKPRPMGKHGKFKKFQKNAHQKSTSHRKGAKNK